MISYRVSGLPAAPFADLAGLGDAALAARGAKRYIVDEKPGFPDRIELRDLEIGERAILVNYVHLDVDTPYRASHAIFVHEGATASYDRVNEVPDVMRSRKLSLRAFDEAGMMIDALLVDGTEAENAIARLLEGVDVAYIHAHYAARGCFAARIDRA